MRKYPFLFFFLFSVLFSFSQNWQQIANFPAAGRDDGSVFTIGNSVYCGLGNAFGVGPSTDFYKFDPLTDNWLSFSVAPLPALGRQYSCAFSYLNYGFIATGVDANWNATNEVWRYDTLSNSWLQRTSMPDSVQGASCFFINNRAYVCGGRDQNNQCTKKVWEYDVLNDSWLQKTDMPGGGRWRASATVINSKGYLIFGADPVNTFSSKLFEYEPIGDTWTLIDSFPGTGRTYASAGVINNFFVLGFGIDSANTVYNDFYLYDVVNQQWLPQTALPSFGRKGCMAFVFNSSFYITAGTDGALNRLVETWKAGNVNGIYDIENGSELGVYPNPVSDILHVEVRGERDEVRNVKGEIEIRNMLGEKVMGLKGDERTQVDVSELPEGVYFMSVHTDYAVFTRKFVVRR